MEQKGFAKGVVKEVTTGLPSWAKGVIAIALIGGGGFLIYRLAKDLGDKIKSLKDIKELNQLKDDEKQLQNAGVKYSYTQSQYNIFADKLFSALKGADEDEDMVASVMKQMKNDLDILALIKAYGKRDTAYWGWETHNYDLVTAINAYMSDSEIETYVNKPLAANGVNYRF